jgi:hypothetical protein
MRTVEKCCLALRHSKYLHQADWVWKSVRPIYDHAVSLLGRGGLERVMNATDPILVTPQFRCLGERYESEVWRSLMKEIKPADIFADVGVFIGLYTVVLLRE